MQVERPILLIALWAGTGCTGMLGLDDLTYDLEASEDDAGAARPSSASAFDAEPGSPEPDPPTLASQIERAYPARWDASKLLVQAAGAPSDATFLVYDRQSGEVAAHEPRAGGFEVTRTWQWTPGFSSVLRIPASRIPEVWIGYDEQTGLTEYVEAPETTEAAEGERLSGSPGWTHLVAVPLEPGWGLVTYDRGSGHYRFGPAELGAVDALSVRMGRWRRGFTHLMAHPLGEAASAAGVLKLDARSGEVELEGLVEDVDERIARHQGALGARWTSVTVFPSWERDCLLLYDATDGAVETGWLELDGDVTFQVIDEGVWPRGISTILPIRIGAELHAVTHDARTGVADLRRLDPLESSPLPAVR